MAQLEDDMGVFPWPWLELTWWRSHGHGWSWHGDVPMAKFGGGTGTFWWPCPRLPWPRALASAGSPGSQAAAVALPSHASRRMWAAETRARGAAGEGRGG